jgi:hypothetical protein
MGRDLEAAIQELWGNFRGQGCLKAILRMLICTGRCRVPSNSKVGGVVFERSTCTIEMSCSVGLYASKEGASFVVVDPVASIMCVCSKR